MEAVDLCIGKASTNTAMEVSRCKTPMILNACANRVEEMAKKHLLREKIALYEKNPKKIARLIEKDIEKNGYILSLLSGIESASDTSGAERVADELFNLLKSKFPELE
jgi:UDP-N-acetylglucosamine:LPS N-acetylglucosamine transferase